MKKIVLFLCLSIGSVFGVDAPIYASVALATPSGLWGLYDARSEYVQRKKEIDALLSGKNVSFKHAPMRRMNKIVVPLVYATDFVSSGAADFMRTKSVSSAAPEVFQGLLHVPLVVAEAMQSHKEKKKLSFSDEQQKIFTAYVAGFSPEEKKELARLKQKLYRYLKVATGLGVLSQTLKALSLAGTAVAGRSMDWLDYSAYVMTLHSYLGVKILHNIERYRSEILQRAEEKKLLAEE